MPLSMIIEKITGQSFEDFILNNQFSDSKIKLFIHQMLLKKFQIVL
jgi:hypothetical protein